MTRDELFLLELLRLRPGARGMLIDWADELESVARMSDRDLRGYVPVWIDGYNEVECHYNDTTTTCETCERKSVEPDINNIECAGCMDILCPMCDEVSYALRPYVLADLLLRGIWGDDNRT